MPGGLPPGSVTGQALMDVESCRRLPRIVKVATQAPQQLPKFQLQRVAGIGFAPVPPELRTRIEAVQCDATWAVLGSTCQ